MTKRLKLSAFAAAIAALTALLLVIGFKVFAENQDIVTVTATINYYYYDENNPDNGCKGERPFQAFVAHMQKDSDPITEMCHTVPGYKPYLLDSSGQPGASPIESVTISFSEDSNVDVFYMPINVPYKIHLMQQIINSNEYSDAVVTIGSGKTGSIPVEFGTDSISYTFPDNYSIPSLRGRTLDDAFDGFTLMYHQPETIAADGKTEFLCFYDRKNYHVYFELGEGGHGVDPMYLPYEYQLTNVDVSDPVRTGYTFGGWAIKKDTYSGGGTVPTDEDRITSFAPVTKDITYVAIWNSIDYVNYTIVYRNEGLDGTYDYWGSKTISGEKKPGETVSIDDAYFSTHDDPTLTDYKYFTLDKTRTIQENGNGTVTIRGDGSTIITIYYTRNTYKIWFTYARQKKTGSDYVISQTIDTNKSYYIVFNANNTAGNKIALSKRVLENNTIGNKPYAYRGLALVELEGSDADLVKWKFTPVDGKENTYYVSPVTGENDTPVYLHLEYNTYNNQNLQDAYLSEDPAEIYAFIENNYLYLRDSDNEYYFLNDKSNKKQLATCFNTNGSAYSNNNGNKWQLFEQNYKVDKYETKAPSGTGKGQYSQINWGRTLSNLPDVQETETLKHGTFEYDGYTNHYVEISAKYNADVADIWPVDAIPQVGEFEFGSWAVQYNTAYRADHEHANIVGRYPRLGSELILDRTKTDNDLTEIIDGEPDLAEIMYAWWGKASDNIDYHADEIFYEALPGEIPPDGTADTEERVKIGDTWYIRDRTEIFTCAHNSNTRIDPFSYNGFTIIPSEAGGHSSSMGNGHVQKTQVVGKDENGDDVTQENIWTTIFHYNRSRYKLTFHNMGETFTPENAVDYNNILYSQPLTDYEPTNVPAYSMSQYYDFAGWRLNEADEDTIDWDTFTMPDHDLELYAYWKPKQYSVEFYKTEENLNEGKDSLTIKVDYDEDTSHYGANIKDKTDQAESDLGAVPPTFEVGGSTENMIFVGWYYYDNGVLHAFDPDTMTISKNIKLFMQWSASVPAKYNVTYQATDPDDSSKTVEIANPTTGYSYVGLTKTFKAKFSNQLFNEYTESYFPYVGSHSILMKKPDSNNNYTFRYAYYEDVKLRVRYVVVDENTLSINRDAEGNITNEELIAPNILSTKSASVSVQYKPRSGYVPVDYYINHIVTVPEDPSTEQDSDGVWPQNEIVFRYIKNDNYMAYHIKYLIEDDDGTIEQEINGQSCKFREINSVGGMGGKDTNKDASVPSYVGYYPNGYKLIKRRLDNSTDSDGYIPRQSYDKLTFTLDSSGDTDSVELYVFYPKNKYKVKTEYSIESEDNEKIQKWYNDIKAKFNSGELLNDTSTAVTFDDNGTPVTVYKTVYRITDNNKFYSEVHVTAPEITEFKVTGSTERTHVVVHEDEHADDYDISINKISFVYTGVERIMYYYHVVIPDAPDTKIAQSTDEEYLSWKMLNINQENTAIYAQPTTKVTAGQYLPPDSRLYRFEGWYDGTYDDQTQTYTLGSKLTGNAIIEDTYTLKPPGGKSTDQHYFAKYEYIRGDMIIESSGLKSGDESVEYLIKGTDAHNSWIELRVMLSGTGTLSGTIKELPIGNYTVTPQTWAWRYNIAPESVNVTVVENTPGVEIPKVAFTLTMNRNTKWLDGNVYKDNKFSD